jgi:DNA-binding MarR family transcriptional regulator
MSETSDQILVALRRVIRAVDQHSRKLVQAYGLTGPQALLLNEVVRGSRLSAGEIAERVSLSQATVTDIVTRLESRGLVERSRDPHDRRRVLVCATAEGKRIHRRSVPLLQESFVRRLDELEAWERSQLLASLQRIAAMMNAEDLDAAPVLASGDVKATPEAVEQVTAPEDKPRRRVRQGVKRVKAR